MDPFAQWNHNGIFCTMGLQWIPLYKREHCLFSLWKGSHCKFIVNKNYNGIGGARESQWNLSCNGFTMDSFVQREDLVFFMDGFPM